MPPSLNDVIRTEALALHSAETQGADSLLELSGRAEDRALGAALHDARFQALAHARDLGALCAERGWVPGSVRSRSMEAVCAETRTAVGVARPSSVLDALIVLCVQRMGHLRIAGYGGSAALAKRLNDHEAAGLLAESLREERETDERLSRIAEARLNGRAASEARGEGPRA